MDQGALFFLLMYILPGILALLIPFIVGKLIEDRHYKSIHERERAFLYQPAITSRTLPAGEIQEARVALGSVVIGVDHFKRWLGGFRLVFGGEIHSYSSIIDRGRREAILRMKESAPYADLYVNTRLETSTIMNRQEQAKGCLEVVAYSTAITLIK